MKAICAYSAFWSMRRFSFSTATKVQRPLSRLLRIQHTPVECKRGLPQNVGKTSGFQNSHGYMSIL